jgi:hypothetical protein
VPAGSSVSACQTFLDLGAGLRSARDASPLAVRAWEDENGRFHQRDLDP